MRIACLGSSHERRLIHEGHVLKRRLRRLLRDAAGQYRGRDREFDILNHELGHDVIGLVAIQARIEGGIVTLVTAPGAYFNPSLPGRLAELEALARARSSQGRRTLVVTKHQIFGKTPFELAGALNSSRPTARHGSAKFLALTGRRSMALKYDGRPERALPQPFAAATEPDGPEPIPANDNVA